MLCLRQRLKNTPLVADSSDLLAVTGESSHGTAPLSCDGMVAG